MGYDPPPPMRRPERIPARPLVAHGWRWPWAHRHTIEEIPNPGDMGPHAVQMRVEPDGDRWMWNVWFTFDGAKSLMGYLAPSWRQPSPYEVRGRCRDQAKADERARACADDARERYAAKQYHGMRRTSLGHTERLPL